MLIRTPCDLLKNAFHVNSGAIIFKSKHVGRHFCSDFQGVLERSQRFCLDFMGFCPDFHQIKTFGGATAPPETPPPTPVYRCVITKAKKQQVTSAFVFELAGKS